MNLLATAASNTEPGWGKLMALLGGIALCVAAVKVLDRFKAVKEGTESNPFSSPDAEAPGNDDTEVTAPAEAPEEPARKGVRKWFGKG